MGIPIEYISSYKTYLIKKAYKKLAKEFHPDLNKFADAKEKFKKRSIWLWIIW
ncbi:MAG: DnaJ domain-containing protein [Mycoplasmoidaceae bacterium]